ncbi:MAG TPA: flagellar motor protein MotB [Candidatus Limnocylindria bacterium]|nr:flagellar motor protein MotB [Candidatus Limnocylindria bacterium]
MAKKHGHHGGAWKVAYADFVTAMMALFLVLWLTSQDEKIKEAVQRSFNHPFASPVPGASGIIPTKDVQSPKSEHGNFDSPAALELKLLRKLAADFIKTLPHNPETPDEETVKLEYMPEGIRITIFNQANRPIFKPDSPEFTEYGQWVFTTLAWQLSRYSSAFLIELEGHTEHGLAAKTEDYGNWELSADYANAARRKLIEHGVTPLQIRKVAGYADTQPMNDRKATDETNRRVSVLVKVKNDKDPHS